MSEYVDYRIGNFSFWNNRNELDVVFASFLFCNRDLVITKNVKYDIDDEDEKPHDEYKFMTSVKNAKSRLDAIGISSINIEKEFIKYGSDCIDYEPLLKHLNVGADDFESTSAKRYDKYISFDKWKNALRKYVKYEVDNCSFPKELVKPFNKNNECEKIIFYSNNNFEISGYYGIRYDKISPIMVVRLFLDLFADDEVVELDISNLIGWTYSSISDITIDDVQEKVIVLVEGTSDKEILEFALSHTYPHLSNLFYFMSFEYGANKRRQGGCDALSNNIKTFISSKMKTKFIGLFDNDAIGAQKKIQLEHELGFIPDNIRILKYPNLDCFKKYLTIAPNGKEVLDNINERAASIELYLPDEVLKKDGKQLPIIWESLIKYKINNKDYRAYQGVIENKEDIKKNTFSLINDINNQKIPFNDEKWSKIIPILDLIVKAFAE